MRQPRARVGGMYICTYAVELQHAAAAVRHAAQGVKLRNGIGAYGLWPL